MSDSYKTSIKSTSIFGGVQIFKIIIQIIKTKLVAVLLGVNGVGIISLFISAKSIITKLFSFGLETSAVKEVSSMYSHEDTYHFRKTVTIVRKIAFLTGLLGSILMFLFSSVLSQTTFDSQSFTIGFRWISISILFNQLAVTNNAILQGTRKISFLAKSNLIGSFLSLVICVPLYYLYGETAIPYVFVITSIILAYISFFYLNKIKIRNVKIPINKLYYEGKGILMLGLVIAFNGIFSSILTYTLQIFISKHGGLSQVGLFTAGFTIINSYVGLVFNAMGMDYFPRLSSVSNNNKKLIRLINEQIDVALILLGPIIIIFMVLIKWIILLLYSTQFLEIKGMLYYASIGIFFKSIAWAIAYVFLAKGNKKIYLKSETFFNIYSFLFNCLFYFYFGLTGLGISFLVIQFLFFLQVYFLAHNHYDFILSRNTIKIIITQLIFGIFCLGIIKYLSNYLSFILISVLILLSIAFSYDKLRKMVDLAKLFRK